MLRPGDKLPEKEDSVDFTVLDVSDYDPPHVPSKTWRELIKKVWEVDPLTCPQCGSEMRIISLIPAGNPAIAQILLVFAVLPHPAGNIRSSNTKTSADLRAAILLLNDQLDGVLFEFFSVIWTFSFLFH